MLGIDRDDDVFQYLVAIALMKRGLLT